MAEKNVRSHALVAGVFAIIGSLAGVFVQQYSSRQLERRKVFDDWRRDAYVHFIEATKKYEYEQTTENDRALSTAAYTMAVFGESDVLQALAAHWRSINVKPCSEKYTGTKTYKTFMGLLKAMRSRAMPEEKPVSDDDLSMVAYQCEEKEPQKKRP